MNQNLEPLIKNDIAVLGLLLALLAIVFVTSSSSNKFLKGFYGIVPPIFLCYFVPGILNTLGIISATDSSLPYVAMNYLLPASLVLLTLSLDFPSLKKLGGKAVFVFLAGSLGVVVGAPLTVIVCKFISPETFSATGNDEVWRGMAAIAGSWIGGGANQVAMKEMFQPSNALFSVMIAVDVVFSNILLASLLYGATKNEVINRYLAADSSSITSIKERLSTLRLQGAKMPSVNDFVLISAVGFGATAIAHLAANYIGPAIGERFPGMAQKFSLSSTFFWMILTVSLLGLIFSNTPLRKLENTGASKIGTVFLYVMVMTVGMQMDIKAVLGSPVFFLMGFIWISIHILFTFAVAKLIKAPFFFVAVGSQANIGGPASAPVVASAFDPALAPVGALLAVLGYAIGTYGGYLCAILMQAVY